MEHFPKVVMSSLNSSEAGIGHGKLVADRKALEYGESPAEKIARLKRELSSLETEMKDAIKKV